MYKVSHSLRLHWQGNLHVLNLCCLSRRVLPYWQKMNVKEDKRFMQIKFWCEQALKNSIAQANHSLISCWKYEPWLPLSCPKAPFIIGVFSDLIWNSRMESLHPGLLDLLEYAHEGAQGAIVPALLVLGALLKWQIKSFFFLHCSYLSFDQRTTAWNNTF